MALLKVAPYLIYDGTDNESIVDRFTASSMVMRCIYSSKYILYVYNPDRLVFSGGFFVY